MRFSYNQTLILAVAFLAAGQRSLAAITLSNQTATYYYDMTAPVGNGGICAKAGRDAPGWNDMIWSPATYPACAGTGETYAALNSNRIVAISMNLVSGINKALCGKEVKVFDATGSQIILDDGPFFVYDGCGTCTTEPKVDFSVKAYAQMCGGTCGVGGADRLNNPTGFRVEITDKTVFPPA